MKKGVIIGLSILSILVFAFNGFELTGKVTQGPPEGMDEAFSGGETVGPSDEEIECMNSCVSVGCDQDNMTCMAANSEKCGQQCGVDASGPPEPEDEGEACMQTCVVRGCDEFDFQCQRENKEKCEDECGMVTEPEARNEEEQCIRDCVAKVDSSIMCGSSQAGETGNDVCQRCAQECVHLYAGPCLNDEQVTEKEEACKTCEHCYGEPVMGASGEGWDCVVDVECMDASSEFGNDSGIGPGIGQEGYVAPQQESVMNVVTNVGDAVSNFFEGISNFFSGLFG
ncbi:MAG: hypothetical protein GOU97_01690 [Nanoarchaeota archaeon]|nr:hypothetical protein [Nanoarchaeota archaeon]